MASKNGPKGPWIDLEMDDRPVFTLHTDGACSVNPGPGGWGFILVFPDGEERVEYGGEASTTNNRMEMLAVIEGLRLLEPSSEVEVRSDSKYVVDGLAQWLDNWIARGWKRPKNKPVKNEELWRELDDFRKTLTIRTEWVQGHAGDPMNERCDQLAVKGREEAAANAGAS